MDLRSVLAVWGSGILLAPSHPEHHQIIDWLYLADMFASETSDLEAFRKTHISLEMLFVCLFVYLCEV